MQRPCLDCHGTRAPFEDHWRFSRRAPHNDESTTYDIRSSRAESSSLWSELASDLGYGVLSSTDCAQARSHKSLGIQRREALWRADIRPSAWMVLTANNRKIDRFTQDWR